LLDGTRVHGPATRDLDKLLVKFVNANGDELAATVAGDANADPTVGQGLAVPPGAGAVVIDTGKRIRGRTSDGPNTAPDN
jgi:hypothetical protein